MCDPSYTSSALVYAVVEALEHLPAVVDRLAPLGERHAVDPGGTAESVAFYLMYMMDVPVLTAHSNTFFLQT